ncbi:hypothetical protein PFISCL1PPCAC_9696, partial [Pristionchus fissidentatus]
LQMGKPAGEATNCLVKHIEVPLREEDPDRLHLIQVANFQERPSRRDYDVNTGAPLGPEPLKSTREKLVNLFSISTVVAHLSISLLSLIIVTVWLIPSKDIFWKSDHTNTTANSGPDGQSPPPLDVPIPCKIVFHLFTAYIILALITKLFARSFYDDILSLAAGKIARKLFWFHEKKFNNFVLHEEFALIYPKIWNVNEWCEILQLSFTGIIRVLIYVDWINKESATTIVTTYDHIFRHLVISLLFFFFLLIIINVRARRNVASIKGIPRKPMVKANSAWGEKDTVVEVYPSLFVVDRRPPPPIGKDVYSTVKDHLQFMWGTKEEMWLFQLMLHWDWFYLHLVTVAHLPILARWIEIETAKWSFCAWFTSIFIVILPAYTVYIALRILLIIAAHKLAIYRENRRAAAKMQDSPKLEI